MKNAIFLVVIIAILLTIGACKAAKPIGLPEQAEQSITPVVEGVMPKTPIALTLTPAEKLYDDALEAAHKQRWESVISLCDETLDLDNSLGKAYYLKGLALIGLGEKNYSKAADVFEISLFYTNEEEVSSLKEIVDLVIPPDKIVLLRSTYSSQQGRCEPGIPYNITVKIVFFANPEERMIINKIHVSPGIAGKSAINPSIKYIAFGGVYSSVTCVSSPIPCSGIDCFISYSVDDIVGESNVIESNAIKLMY